jgi:hypothetical protein
VTDPDSPENTVIQFPCETETGILLSGFTFDNAVWRVFFMPKGKPNVISFDWHQNTYPDKFEAYSVGFAEGSVRVIRVSAHSLPEHILEVVLLDIEQNVKKEVWHLLEISSYNTTLEVWLDGTQLLTYVDPQPLPGGQIGLGLWASEDENSIVYFDNLSVCELSEPYDPLPPIEH